MSNALLLVQLLLEVTTKAQQLSGILAKAHTEGRDVTDDELNSLAADDDSARARLDALIATKR